MSEHKNASRHWYEKYGEEISPDRIITLSLPFTSNVNYPVPVTLSSFYIQGFYRVSHTEVLNTLRAYIAPKTNLLFFEATAGEYVTNLVALQRNFVLQASLSGVAYVNPENIALPTLSKSDFHYWT